MSKNTYEQNDMEDDFETLEEHIELLMEKWGITEINDFLEGWLEDSLQEELES